MNPEMLWKSLLLAALTLLLLKLAQRRSAAERAAVAHAGVGALLLLPILALALPEWQVKVPQSAQTSVTAVQAAPVAPAPGLVPEPALRQPRSTPAPGRAKSPLMPTPVRVETPKIPWMAFYLLPGALLLLALIGAVCRLAGLRSRAVPVLNPVWLQALEAARQRLHLVQPVELLATTELASPVSFGLRRPVIVLDADTAASTPPPAQAQALLAHELAHVARRDWAKLLMTRIAIAVFWCNPLVWILARRCHQLREEAADDAVLRGAVPGTDYAALLVREARRQLAPSSMLAHGMAAGPSALKQRVSRILDARQRRTPAVLAWTMACAIGALALTAPLAALTPASALKTRQTLPSMVVSAPAGVPALLATTAPAATSLAITWRLQYQAERPDLVQLSLSHTTDEGDHRHSQTMSLNDLQGVTATELNASPAVPVSFRVAREAGNLECRGTAGQLRGSGECEFIANPDYADALERDGIGRPDLRQQLQLALSNVSLTLVTELERQGYPKPDIEKLVEAGIHGVSAIWLRELDRVGYRVGSIDKLVEFRIHGVSAQFISEFAALGYRDLKPSRLVEFRIHGVTAAAVTEFAKLGYRDLAPEQLVEFQIHGVTPAEVEKFAKLGYRDLPPSRLVEFRIHGVSPDTVAAFAQLGYADLSPEKLVEFQIHDVSPEWISEYASLGLRDLSASKLVDMRIHDVSPDYVRQQQANSRVPLSVDELMNRRIHGL